MKRNCLGFFLFLVFLAVAAPGWGFQTQDSNGVQQQQQSKGNISGTGDALQQGMQQQDSQQSMGLDDSSDQRSLSPNPVLTPAQQAVQEQLTPEQIADRTARMQNQTQANKVTPLTDFQRLVAASVGKVLPIYGARLFTNVPSTFAPVSRIPVTPGYLIGPGDELLVKMWGQVTLDGHFTVDRSGAIYIPQVGTIHVAGLSFDKITDFLKSQVGRVFSNFDLNVNMGQLRSMEIFVVGEAQRPGSYTVSSLSTLVNAIFSSGGPTAMGSMRNIQVRRGKDTIATFDLYDLLIKGDKSKDIPLLSGDVVYIPPVGPMIALAGSVGKPGLYELKNESTLKDVLALSGGLATLAHRNDIQIERIRQSDDTRTVMQISLDNGGLSTVLADGDILEVSPILDRFKDAVTLRGNVANPRRFRWFQGMRVRDLIPDKEALLTRDYWEQRNQLGLPVLDSTPDVRHYAPNAPVSQVNGEAVSSSPTKGALALPNAMDNDTNVYGSTNGGSNGNLAEKIQANSANGLTKSTSLDNRQVQAGYGSGRGNAAGTSISAVVTETARRFPVKNSVVLNAPEVDWAYAVIERLDKRDFSSRLLSFNLGRAVLENDSTQNLELLPGDVVTIFSKADLHVPQDQQTKYVRLEGEFAGAGVYRVEPNENLRQLVMRAGGLASKAYLYGSQFTRESARAIQQERMNEYADELERRVKLVEANSATSALNPQDQIADIAALQNARSAVMMLHQARASGRIVLYIKPDAKTLNDIPEFELEDGDTFIVPQIPLSVGVFGSVYTQNQYMYDSHYRAKDYIHMAGGGTRTADTGRSYIVRANGAIMSHQFTSPLFTTNFDSTHLYPGDTVMVPEQVDKRPLLRNLVDVATIIGQFGLGIAAINVLK